MKKGRRLDYFALPWVPSNLVDCINLVRHGNWQRSRGRQPSMQMELGRANPRDAYAFCLRQIEEHCQPTLGDWPALWAKKAIPFAQLVGGPVRCIHNDVILTALPSSTPASVGDEYELQMDKRVEALNKLPKHRAEVAHERAQLAKHQAQTDLLIEQLQTLNFRNTDAVLRWVEIMERTSGYEGVVIRYETVIAAFRDHGFEPIARPPGTGKKIGECHDEEEAARDIIGMMLSCLNGWRMDGMPEGKVLHAIHQRVGEQVEEWRLQFRSQAA